VKRVLLPLWNSYSFFVTYANIDNYQGDANRVPDSTHPLDQWILSVLYHTEKKVSRAFRTFYLNQSIGPVNDFIEELTNWYIRQSRSRFWGGGLTKDKNDAYDTLYYVLVTTMKLLAPSAPFISEFIYRNLTGEESVHLSRWPEVPERFKNESLIEENKLAIKLLQKNGIVAEAQFVMGLEHETPETIEETFQLCKDWDPDMANWTIYTPWPFSDLFKELGDKVEVRDYSKYNFVSPIIKPDNMEREDVLKGVLKSYARFYARKTFFGYPWIKDPYVRKYMLGCLKAFAQTTITKRFYDIDRVKTKNRKIEIDLGFDKSRILTQEEVKNLKELRPEMVPDMSFGLKEAGYQREHQEHDWDDFDESTVKDRQDSTVRNC